MADRLHQWDVEFPPMALDIAGTELVQVQLGSVMITHLSTDCRHVHQGASPPGAHTFGLLAEIAQTVRWCGEALDTNQMPLFSPAQDFTASAKSRFDVYTRCSSFARAWRSLSARMSARI
jgi:hypothetical protein